MTQKVLGKIRVSKNILVGWWWVFKTDKVPLNIFVECKKMKSGFIKNCIYCVSVTVSVMYKT